MSEETKSDKFLPAARIRTIMKSSADPDVLNVKEEALLVVCRATETFIQLLTKESLKCCDKSSKNVEYNQLAEYVQGDDTMEFLRTILPKKITVKEFRQIMEREKKKSNSSDASSSEDDDENDEEDDEGDSSGSSSEPAKATKK